MPKPKEPTPDFELSSGEKVFTFEELGRVRANLDEFELIGTANDGSGKGLKGNSLKDEANFADRRVFRRKAGNIGKELIKK